MSSDCKHRITIYLNTLDITFPNSFVITYVITNVITNVLLNDVYPTLRDYISLPYHLQPWRSVNACRLPAW